MIARAEMLHRQPAANAAAAAAAAASLPLPAPTGSHLCSLSPRHLDAGLTSKVFDAIVVGAGGAHGSAALYHLAKRGAQVGPCRSFAAATAELHTALPLRLLPPDCIRRPEVSSCTGCSFCDSHHSAPFDSRCWVWRRSRPHPTTAAAATA